MYCSYQDTTNLWKWVHMYCRYQDITSEKRVHLYRSYQATTNQWKWVHMHCRYQDPWDKDKLLHFTRRLKRPVSVHICQHQSCPKLSHLHPKYLLHLQSLHVHTAQLKTRQLAARLLLLDSAQFPSTPDYILYDCDHCYILRNAVFWHF